MSKPPPPASQAATAPANDDAEEMLESTPANPTPQLLAALRSDNRSLLLRLLHTDLSLPPSSARNAEEDEYGDVPEPVSFRQCLLFGDETLRTLLLRHVLSDEEEQKTAKGKKKNRAAPRDVDDLPLPPHAGVVSTRVLRLDAGLHNAQGAEKALATGAFQTATATSDTSAEVSLLEQRSSNPFATEESDFMELLSSVDVMTYFVRPSVAHATAVGSWVRKCSHLAWESRGGIGQKGGSKVVQHRIVFVPHANNLCTKILSDCGVAAMPNVTLEALPIDLVPVDTDVFTLGSDAFPEKELEGLTSEAVSTVAQSLRKIQDAAGVIGRVQSLGPTGEDVVRTLFRMTVEDYELNDAADAEEDDLEGDGDAGAGPDAGKIGGGEVDALLVLDRRVDLVTPMLTPLTYEGLLDDVLGIESGFVQVGSDVVDPPDNKESPSKSPATAAPPTPNKKVVLPLNDTDSLYAEVRNQHLEKFGSFLQDQAKALKESHSNFTNRETKKDLTEIHKFVKQIPIFTQNLRSLTNHIHLAELVKETTEESTFRERWQTERAMVEGDSCIETLEDLIACQYPPYRLLRLLCLQSLVSGGIKSSKFDSLRREVVQTYGYEFLFVLNNLEQVGLLRRRETLWMETSSPFSSLRKTLTLVNAEVNTVEPDDVSYASSGYAPLTARLVQAATQGWAGKDEALRELPGRLIDVTQRYPPEGLSVSMKRSTPGAGLSTLANSLTGGGGDTKKTKPILMVYFVGGLTFMEIAALRFLSKRPSFPFHIVCCTTKIVNGSTFLRSLS